MNDKQLTLVLTRTFQNIPRELFENSADEFLQGEAIDRLYQWDAVLHGPFSNVYEMQDDSGEVCGVLWLIIDPVLNALVCRFVSALPEYRGNISSLVDNFMAQYARYWGLDTIFGATQKNPEYWKSFGWKVANTKTIKKEVK